MIPHHTNWTPGIVVALIGFAVSLVVFFLSRSKSQPAAPKNPAAGPRVTTLKAELRTAAARLRDLAPENTPEAVEEKRQLIERIGGVQKELVALGETDVAAAAANTTLADLNERVQFVVEQLRELEADRHLVGDAYVSEKARLEQEGAAALRARADFQQALQIASPALASATSGTAATAAGAAAPSASPAPAGFWARNRELKGALWGAGIVGFFVLAGFLITSAERDRGTGSITGMVPPNDDAQTGAMQRPGPDPQAAQADEDPHFKAFLERAQKNPQDTEAAAYAAHVLIREQRFDEAEKLTNQALAADPFHVESRIHRCVLRATEGQLRESVDELGRIARLYPDSYEALLFRGAIAMQIGESRVALESFERFVAEAPQEEQPPQVQDAMAMLRQQLSHPNAP